MSMKSDLEKMLDRAFVVLVIAVIAVYGAGIIQYLVKL